MNWPLMRKTVRDYAPMACGTVLLLVLFVVFFMFAIKSMPFDQGRIIMKMPWVRNLMSALAGADILETMTPTGMMSFVFTHPMMWTLVITFVFTLGSAAISGEIDRGSVDLIATLPMSRSSMYTSHTVVLLAFGVPICGAVWVGVCVGRPLVGADDVQLGVLGVVVVHLFVEYVFLSCLAMAVSATCSRRTSALTICFVIVFYAFLLNLLSAFGESIRSINFTGFLHYYRPLPIVRDRAWQGGDLAVLLSAGAVLWITGLVVFRRRDIPAR